MRRQVELFDAGIDVAHRLLGLYLSRLAWSPIRGRSNETSIGTQVARSATASSTAAPRPRLCSASTSSAWATSLLPEQHGAERWQGQIQRHLAAVRAHRGRLDRAEVALSAAADRDRVGVEHLAPDAG